MAEIIPLRGWRYNQELSKNIQDLTSPLFDVVSIKQREALYQNPYNSIHLSVPPGENPAQEAAIRLQTWKTEGILKQDYLPGIYVYYQYFRLPGSEQEYCRKGFMCHIWTYDWADKVLLRHENTIPASVNDRTELLAATHMQVSPTHGLYTDPNFILEKYMDESIQAPLHESEDYQGVRDVVAVIQDVAVVREFMKVLQPKQILLADGHHRYEGSLQFRKRQTAANPYHTGKEAYNYHFIYLTNTEAHDLRILPTHRLLLRLPLTNAEFLKKIETYFTITALTDPYDLNEIIVGKKWAFGLYLRGVPYKIRLKPEVHHQMAWEIPDEVKDLDLTVLHYFVLEKILGISQEAQRNSDQIQYIRSFAECLARVDHQEAEVAFITNGVSMEQVKTVCYSGALMPQKSTFFYPKVISGLVFSSIKQNEFYLENITCF
ncbi:DUF1015 domain-containing protein [Adhaeribacter pallidiroseus]|uniref:DUF1015 domain-containing protein n=1 Tax=Adhaeribacter pallidiroseus TaxID=2072847 RepID=A0A369QIU1_9BACT|nr:DUF1015 domain-containing protein [Adhaeribacter pallidiroseus]RDC63146.1 hypothetical protein AHMF7616_01747 [Adhaeribacter pallidiroseus]